MSNDPSYRDHRPSMSLVATYRRSRPRPCSTAAWTSSSSSRPPSTPSTPRPPWWRRTKPSSRPDRRPPADPSWPPSPPLTSAGRNLSGQTAEAFYADRLPHRALLSVGHQLLPRQRTRCARSSLRWQTSRIAETSSSAAYPNAGLPNEFGELRRDCRSTWPRNLHEFVREPDSPTSSEVAAASRPEHTARHRRRRRRPSRLAQSDPTPAATLLLSGASRPFEIRPGLQHIHQRRRARQRHRLRPLQQADSSAGERYEEARRGVAPTAGRKRSAGPRHQYGRGYARLRGRDGALTSSSSLPSPTSPASPSWWIALDSTVIEAGLQARLAGQAGIVNSISLKEGEDEPFIRTGACHGRGDTAPPSSSWHSTKRGQADTVRAQGRHLRAFLPHPHGAMSDSPRPGHHLRPQHLRHRHRHRGA